MKKSIFLLTLILIYPMISNSQSLSGKVKVALKGVTNTLNKIERALTDLEEKKANINPTLIQNFKVRATSIERDLKKTTDKLAKLPGNLSEVSTARNRLKQANQSWASIQKFYTGAGESNANAEGEWSTVKESEQYKKDKETIRAYTARFSSPFKLDVDYPNAAWIKNSKGDYYEEKLAILQNWDQIKQEVAGFRSTYAKYEPFPGDPMSEIKALEKYIIAREADFQLNVKNGIALLENRQKLLEGQIKDAKERHQAAINYGQAYTGIDKFILDENSLPMQTLRESERVVALNTAFDSSFKSKSNSTLSKLQATFEEAANFAAEYTMGNKEKPVNEYNGAGYDKMVALVKQRFTGEKVLGVYFESNWGLTEEYRYDASYGSARKVKYSTLNGKVYLALDGEYALERHIYVQKDHLNGDALRLFGDFRQYGNNPPLRVKFPMNKF